MLGQLPEIDRSAGGRVASSWHWLRLPIFVLPHRVHFQRRMRFMREAPAPNRSATARLDQLLGDLVRDNGSDLLLIPGAPASIRSQGEVRGIGDALLDGPEIEAIVSPALTPHALKQYQEAHIADSSYRVPGIGRFRINLHREQGQAAAAIRALPPKVPSIHDLHLPAFVELLAQLPRGLVLIGGPAGSGKSTTLAALVHEINRNTARHIITIEDPIEYQHTHLRGLVEQVEIGLDAPDFPTALRAAVRQAPDVIVVGEMRDPETMRIAVAAAETGHLVLSRRSVQTSWHSLLLTRNVET